MSTHTHKDAVLHTFLDLVQIASHSLQELGVFAYCKERLEKMGLSVREDSAGEKLGGQCGNLIATLPANDSTRPKILLMAHMDTVQPGQNVKPVVRDEVIYSDGSTVLGADDKAGITAILTALERIIQENLPHGQIQVLLTIAEEIGLQGAKNLDFSLIDADWGLSLDTGGALGTLPVAGPAQAKFEAQFIGRSAHAGVAPERGISAIQVAAKAVANMPHGRIDDETTANIGSFEGMSPTNVVAERARLLGEVRSRNKEKLQRMLQQIEEIFDTVAKEHGAKLEFEQRLMYEGFRYPPEHPARQRVERALRLAGFEPNPVEVGGGSDANILSMHKLPVLNIGIGYEDIHTTQEHIQLSDIMSASEVAVVFCTME